MVMTVLSFSFLERCIAVEPEDCVVVVCGIKAEDEDGVDV